MNIKNILLVGLAVALAGSIVFRPSPKPVIPTIVTHYDTVTQIDTQWVTKLKHDTVYKENIVERVIAQKPETVKVFVPLSGITAIKVGKNFGDTTKVLYFTLTPVDSLTNHFFFRKFEQDFYTPGPLESLVLTNPPRPVASWYNAPRICTLGERAKIAGAGAAFITIIRLALGR